jgi:hypothetical protein
MPTYSPKNRAYSYKVTDGKYYRKLEETPSGVETEAFIVNSLESTYVEVNFGTEYEVVKVFLIPTLETPIITGLKIKLYNQYRDVIALLDPSIQNSDYSNVPISLTGVNNIIFPSATNIIGVSILRKYSEFLTQAGQMSENVATGATIIPLGFSCPPGQVSPATTSCANVPLLTVPRFNPGPNGGIPCRYIRVFNVSQYVQISQIMAYGADGTNYAYQKGAQSESIFPGTYPAKVTDGLGGYFHNARTWADSYRSSGKRYDFIEIDLTGQVCADSIGVDLYSGVGGQMDFIRGASLSKGGKAIIAMASQTEKGISKISSMLKQGAGVVTTRAHVQYIVTEYGIVNLHGKNIAQRAKDLIGIAHPNHRERLEKEAHDLYIK